ARPRGCRPRGGYVTGYRAGVLSSIGPGRRRRRLGGLRPPVAPRTGCTWSGARRWRGRLRQTRTMLQRPPAGTIPDAPGSYQFRDRDGRVIYVGKAKSLRSRLSNYFGNAALLPPRTAQMV